MLAGAVCSVTATAPRANDQADGSLECSLSIVLSIRWKHLTSLTDKMSRDARRVVPIQLGQGYGWQST